MLFHCVDEAAGLAAEQAAASESALASWAGETIRGGVNLHGGRLQPAGDATTVRVRADRVLVADGPSAETREQIAGYDVIECADLDEAIEVAARHPVARLGTAEVRPCRQP
jgi:hypothetical protein